MELLSVNNLGVTVLSSIVLLLTIALRRRYASPISDIPGPFWAPFSIFWDVWQVANGHIHETMITLHEKHGMFLVEERGLMW